MIIVGLEDEPFFVGKSINISYGESVSGDDGSLIRSKTSNDKVGWRDYWGVMESVVSAIVVIAFSKGVSDELGVLLVSCK